MRRGFFAIVFAIVAAAFFGLVSPSVFCEEAIESSGGAETTEALTTEAAPAEGSETAQPAMPSETKPADELTPVPAGDITPVEPSAQPTAEQQSQETAPAAGAEPALTPEPAAEAGAQPSEVVPAAEPVEEKKEEAKPVEKPKKKAVKKAPKLPDLAVAKVISKPAGEEMELLVKIKNKGTKDARNEEGSAIRLAVRLEGETATREMKVDGKIAAGKKKEISIGKYPKEKIEGKNIFVTVSFEGKELGKVNNVWNKPAEAAKK